VVWSQLLLGSLLITTNAIIHVSCLVWLAGILKHIGRSQRFIPNQKGLIFLLAVAVLGIIGIHTASAWAWAGVYFALGEFSDWPLALYFSVVTLTTLGYGDITLSGRWQLLASFEAMGGLILFGASTAFLLGVTRKLFQHLSLFDDRGNRPESE
jgi:hypothetical protein